MAQNFLTFYFLGVMHLNSHTKEHFITLKFLTIEDVLPFMMRADPRGNVLLCLLMG